MVSQVKRDDGFLYAWYAIPLQPFLETGLADERVSTAGQFEPFVQWRLAKPNRYEIFCFIFTQSINHIEARILSAAATRQLSKVAS